MWVKLQVASKWDMAWFCNKCERMMPWKTKGWVNSQYLNYVYCNECKEKITSIYKEMEK